MSSGINRVSQASRVLHQSVFSGLAQLGVKGDWLLIQPPEGTTAYIAAKLLRQEPVVEEVMVADTEVVATNETELIDAQPPVTEPDEAAALTEETAAIGQPEGGEESTDLAQLPEVAPELEAIPADPLPPRIVSREGIVKTYTQPHAPSHYRLVSADNGRLINYLYTTSTNLDLSRYIGFHIIATGEESLDERWNTPVLTLKRIAVVDFEQ